MKKGNPLFDIINVIVTTVSLKNDADRRPNIVRFGVVAIIHSILLVLFVFGGVFLIKQLTGGNSDAAMLLIFTLAGIALCLGGALVTFLGALVRVICQLVLNRKVIGWIALVLFIAAIAVSIVIILGL